MKEFICLSCWETFEFASSDLQGKQTVSCPHCGAEQELLDDVVGLEEGNLDESPRPSNEPEEEEENSDVALLLGAAETEDSKPLEIEPHVELEDRNEPRVNVPTDMAAHAPLPEADSGVELSTDTTAPSEMLMGSEFDPFDAGGGSTISLDDPSGIELLITDASPSSEADSDELDQSEVDLLVQQFTEEIEATDLLDEVPLENSTSAAMSSPNTSDEETSELSLMAETESEIESEIGSVYSKENAEANAALSRSVQKLVSNITGGEQIMEPVSSLDDTDEFEALVEAAARDIVSLDAKVPNPENQISVQDETGEEHGLDLSGLTVEQSVEQSDGSDEPGESDISVEDQPLDVEPDSTSVPAHVLDDTATEESIDFALVTETLSDIAEQVEAAPVEKSELADAVSGILAENVPLEGEPSKTDGSVKTWRVRLKSGLVLSFPSLVVVQGWAADKDTSSISLAKDDGEFEPYEQVVGLMQTIETKAISPSDTFDEEEKEEIVDGLSAAARAAAQRRRDGKMDNITAEYQFRKDAFARTKASSGSKKMLVLVGTLVFLAGSVVALEFLAVVDFGLGFSPSTPTAASPPPTPKRTKEPLTEAPEADKSAPVKSEATAPKASEKVAPDASVKSSKEPKTSDTPKKKTDKKKKGRKKKSAAKK